MAFSPINKDTAPFASACAAFHAKRAAMDAVLVTMKVAIESSTLVETQRRILIAARVACKAATETRARVDSVVSFVDIFVRKMDFVQDLHGEMRPNSYVMESLAVGRKYLRDILSVPSSVSRKRADKVYTSRFVRSNITLTNTGSGSTHSQSTRREGLSNENTAKHF